MSQRRTVIGSTVAAAFLAMLTLPACAQTSSHLREYSGAYQWSGEAFVYLQLWNEFAGTNQLVAFDESGEVRTLYPTGRDRFVAGPGAAVPKAVESRIEFQRDSTGKISSLTWHRDDSARVARRVEIEQREDVRFSNGDVQLTGTLISPKTGARHPAVILVHGSGPGDRESMLPFARFLIRHGMAVLGYDKRGVGESTGDWNTASFEDLAGDVVDTVTLMRADTVLVTRVDTVTRIIPGPAAHRRVHAERSSSR